MMQSNTRAKNVESKNTVRATVFMALLALQFGCQPILNREYINNNVISTVTVFVTEAAKLLLAFSMLVMEGSVSCMKGWKLTESLKCAALPSVTYAFQNLLLQQAYRNLDFVTFNLLNQSKLLSAAAFIYLFMGHKQSPMQCVALLMLMAGAVLISSTSAASQQRLSENKFWEGVVPVMIASLLSGFAGALSQVALQGQKRNSYLYTMELASYSMISLLFMTVASPSRPDTQSEIDLIMAHGMWHGWTVHTWIPVVSNALGGIFVGQVTKYAGGVNKGFAIIVGIVLTTILQNVVYSRPIPGPTWAAMPLIALAIAAHALFPPSPSPGPTAAGGRKD